MLIAERIALAALGLGLCVCFAVAIKFPVPRISEQVLTEVNGIVKGDFEYNGRKVHYESFDPSIPSVSDAHRKFDRDVVKRLNSLINNIVHDAIIKRKNSFDIGITYGSKLIRFIRRNWKDFSKLQKSDATAEISSEYNEQSMNMLTGIMRKSKSATPPALQPARFVVSVHDLFDILLAVVEKSPVGLQINFNEFTIDGRSFESLVAEHVAYIRKDGHGLILKLVDSAVEFAAFSKRRELTSDEDYDGY